MGRFHRRERFGKGLMFERIGGCSGVGERDSGKGVEVFAQAEHRFRTRPGGVDEYDDELFVLFGELHFMKRRTVIAGVEDIAAVLGIIQNSVESGVVCEIDTGEEFRVG